MSLGGGAYFEERNAQEGVPYGAPKLPDVQDVFGPTKADKEKEEEEVWLGTHCCFRRLCCSLAARGLKPAC